MFRRALLLLLASSFLLPAADATWSIVVVNRRTREVAVGVATCLPNSNLTRGLPVVIHGVGAGIIQSSGNPALLPPMGEALRAGLTPAEVLAAILPADGGVGLQIGIVAMNGEPVTFTGNGVGAARKGVAGEIGDLAYAIQGNVLAGRSVIDVAERALREAEGDLTQRLLAGMVAARFHGGDGRCSCTLENFGADPDDCGAPPEDFRKSAHSAALLVTRLGDPQPPCVTPNGVDCANLRSYMRLVIRGANAQIPDPDPIDQVVERYAEWRAARVGRPDGIRSRVSPVTPMPADGLSRQRVSVQLVDLEGNALTTGGARLTVEPLGSERPLTQVEEILDHGDGTYSFTVIAAPEPEVVQFAIRATDEVVDATLYPYLEVRSGQFGRAR